MALRCLLFTSDEGTAEPIRQVLAGLGVEGEYCTEGATAIEEVTKKNFQIVIIDWDKQPEAGQLLSAARERKAAERPLTLAVVSDDVSVPKALQAGANSILRKPILVNQVNDTLTTARDLLRAKQESAATAAFAAAAGVSASPTTSWGEPSQPTAAASLPAEKSLEPPLSLPRAQTAPKGIAPEFVTAVEPVIPIESEEPISAPVAENKLSSSSTAASSPPPPDGPRGLEWYLKTRLGAKPASDVAPMPEPEPAPARSNRANPELLGFDQMPVRPTERIQAKSSGPVQKIVPERKTNEQGNEERKEEAELFAYMAGEGGDSAEAPARKSSLGKRAIFVAFVLAGSAIVAAPQAPWHAQMRGIWARGHQTIHAWLYPQPLTTPPAPAAHEDFARAGDEYKLPVSENIPDATTDPSQIQVLPVVDPTAKKPNDPAAPVQLSPEGSSATPSDQPPASAVQVIPVNPEPARPVDSGTPARDPMVTPPSVSAPPHRDVPASVSAPLSSLSSIPPQPAPSRNTPPHRVPSTGNVPSSLNTQLASMTPELSGNKAPENAMDSIEPVAVSEAAERALLTEQPTVSYPATAKGQHGIVILQVLIGRDGTVQDAKFLQGSLAFARAAIDGVKPWKFKPYLMNGRPASVQTSLTLSFKPGQ